MLRLLRHTPTAPVTTPEVLGVDDFAWRKGDRYGTILVDLQRHHPIGLLPDREAAPFETWLRTHPGVEGVSRDRASASAEAAKQAVPDATQVADRYHLVANLRDTLQRLLDRNRPVLPPLQDPSGAAASSASPGEMQPRKREDMALEIGKNVSPTHAQALGQMRRSRRDERYQAVRDLHEQGVGVRAIAAQAGMSRNTVRRYLHADTFPEQGSRRKRRSLLDPYVSYLRKRWEEGCQNAAQLAQEIRERGYHGSHTILRSLVSEWRASDPTGTYRTRGSKRRASAPSQRCLSARQASFLLIKRPETLSETQRRYLEQMCQASDELHQTYELS